MPRYKVRRRPFGPLTLVVGFDLSSTTIAGYWRRVDGWTIGWRKWDTSDVFLGDATCAMVQRLMRRWARSIEEEVVYAFIEQPVVAGVRNLQSTIKQAMVQGAVQGSLRNEGVIIVPTSPNSWKKSLRKGGIGKEEVREAVDSIWPGASEQLVTVRGKPDQDLYDAYGLCHHGLATLTRSTLGSKGKVQRSTD